MRDDEPHVLGLFRLYPRFSVSGRDDGGYETSGDRFVSYDHGSGNKVNNIHCQGAAT